MLHQHVGERRADHRTAAKSHDGHSRRHAAAIGEPFDECRDRRDVSEPEPDSADHTRAQPEDPELMPIDPGRRNDEAATPAQRRHDGRLPGACSLEPGAEERRARAEKDKEQRVHPAEQRLVPVVGGGGEPAEEAERRGAGHRLRDPNSSCERQPEHGEPIRHADAQVHAQRGWRHEPAIEPGARDGATLVENARQRIRHAAHNEGTRGWEHRSTNHHP